MAKTAEAAATLLVYLDRLAARHRTLLLVRAALQLAAAGAIGAVALTAALSLGGSPEFLRWGLAPLAAVLGLAAAAWPLLARWPAAGDRLEQARVVEAQLPELRSRLITVVDRAQQPQGGSVALLERAAGRAAEAVARLPPEAVHPTRQLHRPGGASAVAILLALIVSLLAPRGPLDALSLILGRAPTAPPAAASTLTSDTPALVGDIVLRYVFPEYTGLAPVEIANSDGTIHAPPGTRVEITARTGEVHDSAELRVSGLEPQRARLLFGRDVSTALTVGEAGTWQLALLQGETLALSPEYPILTDADAPPVVALRTTPRAEVPIDAPLGIEWSVNDDFGVRLVRLELDTPGGTREIVLRDPLEPRRSLDGQILKRPRELGLTVGQEITARVVAFDNDITGEGKRGASADVTFTIVGAQGYGQNLVDYHRRLRDAMLPALADFLLDPIPPGRGAAGMSRWVETSRARIEPIDQVYREQWGDTVGSGIDASLVDDVLESTARLLRFTLTTWDPGVERRVTRGDLATFTELHARTIAALERGVIVLDGLLRKNAFGDLRDMTERVARAAQRMAALEDPTAERLLSSLDQLQRMLTQLQEATKQLAEGQLQEFMNTGTQAAQNIVEEIRRALEAGDIERAQELIAELAAQLSQMAEGLNDQLAQQQQNEDQMAEDYASSLQESEALERDQRQLTEDLAEARERLGSDIAEAVAQWERLRELAREARESAEAARDATGDGGGWRQDSIRRMERIVQESEALHDAIRAGDVEAALYRASPALRAFKSAELALGSERKRSRAAGESVPDGLVLSEAAAGRGSRAVKEIREILDSMDTGERPQDPRMTQAAQDLAERQETLRDRADALSDKMREIERLMPTADGSASSRMRDATESMERAGDRLHAGDDLSGEGYGRDAARQVAESRQLLQKQMEDYRQMQRAAERQSGRRGQGSEGGHEPGEEQTGRMSRRQIELPAPESFRVYEDYHRALLQGAEGSVPEEYRALKDRYFEELIRQ